MDHPFQGVWSVEARVQGRPNVDRSTYAYHAEGVLAIAGTNFAAQGVWAATGHTSVVVSVLLPTPPGEGMDGWFEFTGRAEMSADGSAFQLDGTITRPTPSGTPVRRQTTIIGRRMVPPPTS